MVGGGFDFLMVVVAAWLVVGFSDGVVVAGVIAVGCFCSGEDRTKKERGRRKRIKNN